MGMATITPDTILNDTSEFGLYTSQDRHIARTVKRMMEALVEEEKEQSKRSKHLSAKNLKVPKNANLRGNHSKPFYSEGRW
ncbi:hypothetical protein VCHA53O466_50032 [Vibrio chagasii]|nr:hypothetical protein VCHA53O466_50032 [Vibrio chagasii]